MITTPAARVTLEKFAAGFHLGVGGACVVIAVYHAMHGRIWRPVIYGAAAVYEIFSAADDHLEELRRMP